MSVTLQDVELAAAIKHLERARVSFDQASLALVRAQNDAGENATGAQKKKLSAAEKRVETEAASLDAAERELRELRTRRAAP